MFDGCEGTAEGGVEGGTAEGGVEGGTDGRTDMRLGETDLWRKQTEEKNERVK